MRFTWLQSQYWGALELTWKAQLVRSCPMSRNMAAQRHSFSGVILLFFLVAVAASVIPVTVTKMLKLYLRARNEVSGRQAHRILRPFNVVPASLFVAARPRTLVPHGIRTLSLLGHSRVRGHITSCRSSFTLPGRC